MTFIRNRKHAAKLATSTIAAMLAVAASASPSSAQAGGPGGATGAAAGSSTGTSNGAPTAGAPGTAPASPASPGAPSGTAPSTEAAPATSPSTGTASEPATNSAPNPNNGALESVGSIPTPESAGDNTNIAPVHYDLNRTITEALAASTDLANAIRNVEIDNKKSDEAKANARPHVSGEGQATRFDQATKVSFGGGAPIQIIGDHTELVALNVSDNLDIAGEIAAAADQSHLQSLEDRVIAQQIANRRILNAHTVYYNLLRAQHQVSVAQASLATATTQQKLAVQLNQQQVGQKIDVLRANTQVATAQQQLTAAENNLGIARQNFDNLVGQPIDTPVTVDDISGVTVGEPVTSSTQVGAPSPNITLYTVPESEVEGIDLNKTIAAADDRRPEVLAAALEVRVQQTGIKIARSGLEPSLSLAAAGDYYPTTSFQSPRQRTASITATLQLPLYDGGATRDKVDEAKLKTENAKASLSARKNDVALDVGQAYLNLITAASQVDAANSALQQAIGARQLAQIRYEGQVGLYLEVTDAESALVTAENNQVNAVYDYFVAKANFQNATGTPDVPANAVYPVAPTK